MKWETLHQIAVKSLSPLPRFWVIHPVWMIRNSTFLASDCLFFLWGMDTAMFKGDNFNWGCDRTWTSNSPEKPLLEYMGLGQWKEKDCHGSSLGSSPFNTPCRNHHFPVLTITFFFIQIFSVDEGGSNSVGPITVLLVYGWGCHCCDLLVLIQAKRQSTHTSDFGVSLLVLHAECILRMSCWHVLMGIDV